MAEETQKSTMPAMVLPDEKVFRAHLVGGTFRQGESRKRWRLIAIPWPVVIIAVSAAAREGSPCEYSFRFDCTNYPNDAPTARLWDTEREMPLPHGRWPYGAERFADAFNSNWMNGEAMYLPCDRRAIAGHDAWRQEHPHMIWTPQKAITFYLEILHEYLHSKHYQGALRSPA